MAKKSSNELLTDVLGVLNQILAETKKTNDGGGATPKSKLPGAIGLSADDVKNMGTISESVKVLSQAVPKLAKIGKDDWKKIAQGLEELGSAIRSFSLDKNAFEGISNMLNAFVAIHNIIYQMADNFMSTIIKLNPIKGKILGWIIGKFYGNVIRGMGTAFVKDLVWLFSFVPSATATIAKKAANLKLMSSTVISILTKENILSFWLAGKLLNQKVGRNIGQFFKAMVDELTGGRNGVNKAMAAAAMAASLAALVGTLTLSLIAVVALVKLADFSDIVLGLGLLSLMIFGSFKLIKKLASMEFKTKSKESLPVVLTMITLLLSLTITLAITVAIAKHNKLYELALGLGMLALLVYGSFKIIDKLSSTQFKNNAKNALLGVTAIVSLMLGLSIAMLISIKLGKNGGWVAIGMLLLAVVTAGSIAIFKQLNKNLTKAVVTNGLYAVGAILALVFGMSITMLIAIKLGKKGGWVSLGMALLLVFTAASIYLFKWLSKNLDKDTITNGLYATGAILMLMFGLGITMLVAIKLGKNALPTLIGMALLLVFTTASIYLFKYLSKNLNEKTIMEAFKAVGAVVALMVGLGIAQLITIKLGKNTGDVLIGSVLLLVFTLASIGLFKLLSKNLKQSTIIKGLIATAGITLMIIGLSIAMRSFVKYLKQVKDITLKDTAKGILLLGGMIIGITVIATILGTFATSGGAILLAAGAVVLVGISLIISMMSRSMMKFAKLIEKVKKITPEDTKAAVSAIAGKGGMIGALIKIMAAFIPLSAMTPFAIAGIIAIRPVISAISQFVDVIAKMAKMQIADQWDKNGKPIHYAKLNPEDFKKASETLTNSFTLFITNLSDGLKGITRNPLFKYIIKSLFPTSKNSSGIGNVIKICSDFIDLIVKMASKRVPNAWDSNGRPTSYITLKDTDFIAAADTLSTAFSTFITALATAFGQIKRRARNTIKEIAEPINQIMQGISSIIQPIMLMAAGKIQIGDKTYDINITNMTKAAKEIVSVVKTFIDELRTLKPGSVKNKKIRKVMKTISVIGETFKSLMDGDIFKSDFSGKITNLTTGLGDIVTFLRDTKFGKAAIHGKKFRKMLNRFSNGMKFLMETDIIKNTDGNFNKAVTNTITGLDEITLFLQDRSKFKNAKKSAKDLKNTLIGMGEGLNVLQPFLAASSTDMANLAKAFKELDAELIEKEQQRTEAIQTMSSNFKDMSANINELNKSMAKTVSLQTSFGMASNLFGNSLIGMGTRAIVGATTLAKDKVVEKFNNNDKQKDEEEKKQHEKIQQQNAVLANTIANAVANALNDWSESHKDITVQFGSDSKKVFGEVYSL